jgi:hypothetical protein
LCGLRPKEKEGRRKDKHMENKERKLKKTKKNARKQHCPFMWLQFLYYTDRFFTNPVFLLMSFSKKR